MVTSASRRAPGSALTGTRRPVRSSGSSRHAHAETGGLFDPTVLAGLDASGCDRSFPFPPPRTERRHRAASAPGFANVEFDAINRTVSLPAGCGLDLGGIGKGLTADRVVEGLVERGAVSVCVSMGGDVRVGGPGPDYDGAWDIRVEDPRNDRDAFVFPLLDEALAQSSTLLRRWRHGSREVHHLIDPRTGESSNSGVECVVVTVREAWRAETLARASADRRHVVPIRDGGLEERVLVAAALGQIEGTVDQDVEAAGLVLDPLERRGDLFVGAKIAHDRMRNTAEISGFVHGLGQTAGQRAFAFVECAAEHVDRGACCRQFEHASSAHAARAAGDDRDLSIENPHPNASTSPVHRPHDERAQPQHPSARYVPRMEPMSADTAPVMSEYQPVLGTVLELCVVAADSTVVAAAEQRALAEIDRLEVVFSVYDDASELCRWRRGVDIAMFDRV